MQRVNLFIWELQKFVTDTLDKIQKMIVSIQNEQIDNTLWPTVTHYWPLLEEGRLVEGLSEFEPEHYSTRRESQMANALSEKPLKKVRREIQEILQTFTTMIEKHYAIPRLG